MAKKPCFLLIIIALVCSNNQIVCAGYYFEAEPEFSWKVYSEDDISNSRGEGGFSFRYEPALDVSLISPRISISGHTEAEIIEYIHKKEFNTVDQDHLLTVALIPQKRSSLFFSAGYTVETDPDRFFEVEESYLGEESGYVVKREKNKTKTFSIGFTHQPRNGNLFFLFTFLNFDTGVTDDTDFYVSILKYTHSFSNKLKLYCNATYSLFDFKFNLDDEGDTDFLEDIVGGEGLELFFATDYELDNFSITFGFTYDFSNNLQLDLSGGWRYTKSERSNETIDPQTGELVADKAENSGDGGIFALSLSKNFAYTTITFKASQNIGSNPDTGASYEYSRLSLLINHDFTNRLKGRVSFAYIHRETDKDDEFGFEQDRDTYLIDPALAYTYSKWLTVQFGYRYSKNENNITNTTTDRNTFFLELRFKLSEPYIFS